MTVRHASDPLVRVMATAGGRGSCRAAIFRDLVLGAAFCGFRLGRSLALPSLLLAIPGMLVAMGYSSAQEEKPREWKVIFHEDFRKGDPHNPNVRSIREGNFRWESGGARITMPARGGKLNTAGIAAGFQIKGDFEITASYEILKADVPTEGYGVGVSIFAAIEPEALNAVSLARRVGQKGNANFLSDRMTPGEPSASHLVRTVPAKSPTGKLRIQRIGSAVTFFAADGDADFVPMIQESNSKKTDVDFGTEDIRYFQVGGDAGQSEAALDMRVLDLTVRADELPGLIERPGAAKMEEPAWMRKARENPGETAAPAISSPPWLVVAVSAGGIGLVLVGGLGIAFVLRRRPTRARVPVPKSMSISFACSGCARKITVKAELAGKKIKCPKCRESVLVPQRKADKHEPSEPSSS